MKKIIQKQREFFRSNETKSYTFRKKQLHKLKNMLRQHEEDIYKALEKDLNKSKHETLTTELGILYTEINFTLKHLKQWIKPKRAAAPMTHKGTANYIYYEPYGVTLIISPWNYPLQLAIAPAIGAIAAGNTVILKPSELTPHTSGLLNKLITETFDPNVFTVIEGGKDISQQLLQERFDYIFFTGSTHVGKIVMEKASKHLTPVTLELGGKSPAIVDEDCNISLTAKRIVWGKFTNAGQTCVAPDYVYVHENIYNKLLKAIQKHIFSLYGKRPLKNKDYVKIINEKHFERLTNLLHQGHIIHGGQMLRDELKIEPTIIENVSWEDPIMQEEIFGPIMPILPFNNLSDVVSILQEKEKPLALYYFGQSKQKAEYVINTLSFGGGCINDTLYHLANPHLPFGGIGHSGMGSYHGKYSFKTCSHQKSMLKQTNIFDLPVRYPGGKLNHTLAKKVLK